MTRFEHNEASKGLLAELAKLDEEYIKAYRYWVGTKHTNGYAQLQGIISRKEEVLAQIGKHMPEG